MKRLTVTLALLTAIVACGHNDDSRTICETRPWGESCVTYQREMKAGTYIGGTAKFDQRITDGSYDFKRAEVFITWECGNEPQFQWMRLDGVVTDDADFDLSSHYGAVDSISECPAE